MTNGGIIEGHTEYSGCSDLSPVTFFPRGPLETCTLHDQSLLVSPKGRFGNAVILMGCVTVRKDVVALKADSVCAPPFPNGSMRVFHGAGTTEEENKAGRWTNISSLAFLRIGKRLDGSGATLRAVSLRKPAIEKEARLRPQHLTFGSGATRMQMRNYASSGGLA